MLGHDFDELSAAELSCFSLCGLCFILSKTVSLCFNLPVNKSGQLAPVSPNINLWYIHFKKNLNYWWTQAAKMKAGLPKNDSALKKDL